MKRARVFEVQTEEGSIFLFRIDPQREEAGYEIGPVIAEGYSNLARKKLRIVGIGFEPRVGGRIAVSDEPIEIFEMEGERVPVYEQETIATVKEIEVPSDILERLEGTRVPSND